MKAVAAIAFIGVMLVACNEQTPEPEQRVIPQTTPVIQPIHPSIHSVEYPSSSPSSIDKRLEKLQSQVEWVEKRIGKK